jgi:hypothetical protein
MACAAGAISVTSRLRLPSIRRPYGSHSACPRTCSARAVDAAHAVRTQIHTIVQLVPMLAMPS